MMASARTRICEMSNDLVRQRRSRSGNPSCSARSTLELAKALLSPLRSTAVTRSVSAVRVLSNFTPRGDDTLAATTFDCRG